MHGLLSMELVTLKKIIIVMEKWSQIKYIDIYVNDG